ncbi:GNAT family N-acetyltransferase [uncultured Maribacter sp.]|uniref:GNAT family N-acetyltransferase n=1 Tax=uncultured Maribacter sp. TaxID=431308 RepID=UPI002604CDEB|nr:GNAT family N-acetyltransferase [uncultured Maribacter sp.]
MTNNPFLSDIFKKTWLNHFNKENKEFHFSNFKKLRFVKFKNLPLYINVGKTHTKGISYAVDTSDTTEIDGKVFLMYDIPTFFNLKEISKNRLKTHKIKQYPGFLINLELFQDLNEYMAITFKKSSRYKLKKYAKKLETCFDIDYKMFRGEISKEEYDYIFSSFNTLLKKRFDAKKITNNNLEKKEWGFYYEVAYPMILEKKAGLFVIYNEKQPIGVTLCYFSDEIIFDAITVFDIDYSKFHLGSVTIMKLIEWSISHKFKIFDFSKGYFDYKKRWASNKYDFEYHLLYDSKSYTATFIAFIIKNVFEFKQFLRDKKVNDTLHKFSYKLKNYHKTNKKKTKKGYKSISLSQPYKEEKLELIHLNEKENNFLKPFLHEFLYLNTESINSTKVYYLKDKRNTYIFEGLCRSAEIVINLDYL